MASISRPESPKILESIACPGCGLEMPPQPQLGYDGYFNTSPECWGLFAEVVGEDFSNPALFGAVHQLTVDAYAVQHAGGPHPDKSVGVHLSGLYLAFEIGMQGPYIAPRLIRLAERVEHWPHFPTPGMPYRHTLFEIALEGSVRARIELTRRWARHVWRAWAHAHGLIAGLVHHFLDLERPDPSKNDNRSEHVHHGSI